MQEQYSVKHWYGQGWDIIKPNPSSNLNSGSVKEHKQKKEPDSDKRQKSPVRVNMTSKRKRPKLEHVLEHFTYKHVPAILFHIENQNVFIFQFFVCFFFIIDILYICYPPKWQFDTLCAPVMSSCF